MTHPDIERSLRLIDRSRQRIVYQKVAISKLRFDRSVQTASLANDMLISMEQRLGLLLEEHVKLIARENLMEVSA